MKRIAAVVIAVGSGALLAAGLLAYGAEEVGRGPGRDLGQGTELGSRQGSARGWSLVTAAEVGQAIASELRARGYREEELPGAAEIELPDRVPARAGRRLHAASVCWDVEADQARVRLECGRGDCVPFFAYVRVGQRAKAASCQMEAGRRGMTAGGMTTGAAAGARNTSGTAVRAGERATAVLAGGGLRMTAPVICLEQGGPGEIVRVRGGEGKVFRARVRARGTGEALVEALPE